MFFRATWPMFRQIKKHWSIRWPYGFMQLPKPEHLDPVMSKSVPTNYAPIKPVIAPVACSLLSSALENFELQDSSPGQSLSERHTVLTTFNNSVLLKLKEAYETLPRKVKLGARYRRRAEQSHVSTPSEQATTLPGTFLQRTLFPNWCRRP